MNERKSGERSKEDYEKEQVYERSDMQWNEKIQAGGGAGGRVQAVQNGSAGRDLQSSARNKERTRIQSSENPEAEQKNLCRLQKV